LRWSYTTGGPIVASNVTFGQDVGVGSGDGTIYYLNIATGAVDNELVGSHPIVGLGGAVNFAIATLANGTTIAGRVTGSDITWTWTGTAGLASAPVALNGAVYVTGLDQQLHAFSPAGQRVY
jgi:outer membrane protein assembly factor BamB